MSARPIVSGRRAARAWLAAAFALLGVAAAAHAQVPGAENFRIAHKIERRTATHVEITGRVFNEADHDALEVSIEAEALDQAGKVVARGIAYVSAAIMARGSETFVVKVPLVPGIARYRVRVSSFRPGFGRPEAG